LPGELLIFAGYMANMSRPIRTMARLSIRVSKALVSAERIADVLDIEPDVKDRPSAVPALRLKGDITFHDVCFGYADTNVVLDRASFKVAAGQKVVLIGPSGVGKSTIVRLLLRFYDPQAGSISIDGIDIRDYQLDSLRRNVGIVLQDSLLFATTIRENIAYGKPDASMAEVVAAAKAANAHDFIMRMSDGYDTVIREQGKSLSGGQRQRVAIARTIILDTPILILDEPMRGLDAENKVMVQSALDRLMVGKTSLTITHDLAAGENADVTLTLDGHRVFCRIASGAEPNAFGQRARING
jgi:ATP-binding cassette subfamily B protein